MEKKEIVFKWILKNFHWLLGGVTVFFAALGFFLGKEFFMVGLWFGTAALVLTLIQG